MCLFFFAGITPIVCCRLKTDTALLRHALNQKTKKVL